MLEKSNNIELILNSLDGIKRAEAPPFLYTKIRARLVQFRSKQPKQKFFRVLEQLISKPAVSFTFLLLILLLDGIVLRSLSISSSTQSENVTEETLTRYFIEDLYYDAPESDYNYLSAQN